MNKQIENEKKEKKRLCKAFALVCRICHILLYLELPKFLNLPDSIYLPINLCSCNELIKKISLMSKTLFKLFVPDGQSTLLLFTENLH